MVPSLTVKITLHKKDLVLIDQAGKINADITVDNR